MVDGAQHINETIRGAAARVARHRVLKQSLVGSWHPSVMTLPLVQLRSDWRAAEGKWAVGRTLAQRAVRKQLTSAAQAAVPAECGPDLDRLVEMKELEAGLSALPDATTLGRSWQGLETDFGRIHAAFAWGQRLRAASAACSADPAGLASLRAHLRQLIGDFADLLAPTGAIGSALGRLVENWAALEICLGELTTLAGSPAAAIVAEDRTDWLPALSAHLTGWAGAARFIQEWCAWRGVAQTASAKGLGPLIRALEDGVVGPDDAVRALEANYARWWIDHAVSDAPRLRSFVAARHETRIERFRALDARMLDGASRMARARITASIPGMVLRQADPEYAVLTRELAKRQRHLPVRQLAARMPKALRRLTPCLMMSPLSVAQYLPPDAEPFDLVIFDEASQITTWDAIGSVGRGRQVIVVGDPKQLPPTSFFERRAGGDESEAVEVETHDLDSILDECLGAGIPAVALNWHYRSRHESLIAFSNQVYYGGDLVTFPSPVTNDDAVSFRFVPDGVYARGGARTNAPEARAVVAEALAVLRGAPAHSLGIVTFNAEQQALIEDLLDKARRDDPALERHFGDDAAEPVLIKNLEGVQGEERDVMLFSLTYGPDATGRVSLNFGPLNLSGGERRLNVAVTRARERLVVFGSVRAEQLDLARTGATGVRHLKQFLAFAEHGARSFATANQGPLGDHESPFEIQVAARLQRLGWVLHPQVGVSGFRIDLGIVDPDVPGTYLAGVECDGATYHRGATARDRDRLRQTVLEALGWRILRIWSTDWWTNAGREAERMDGQLKEALDRARQTRAARQKAEAPLTAPEEHEPDAAPAQAMDHGSSEGIRGDETVSSASDVSVELFYDPSYRDRLADQVACLLAEQGPLREDRLVQTIARLHGFGRAGREIRERVMAVVPAASAVTTEEIGRFIWPAEIDPGSYEMFRTPAPGQSCDPGELPLQELVVLARRCLAQVSTEEAALLAMRDACGLQRLRETSRNRCLEALAVALSETRLH